MSRFLPVAVLVLALSPAAFAQKLTSTHLPDDSGTIGLAQGWKLLPGSGGGVALLSGPSGAMMSLGMPVAVVVKGVENQFPDVPVVFPGVPRVDFSDAVQAQVDLMEFLGPKAGVKLLKFRAVEPVQMPNGVAAFTRVAATIKGKPFESFGLYAIMPVDNAQGMFYFSEISAPAKDYPRLYSTMMAMWNSWSVSDKTLKSRLAGAAKALGEVDVAGTVDSVVRNRREAGERAAEKWNDVIRQ